MKVKIATIILIVSVLAVVTGMLTGEWKKIYLNGRILCLTCIGIK